MLILLTCARKPSAGKLRNYWQAAEKLSHVKNMHPSKCLGAYNVKAEMRFTESGKS